MATADHRNTQSGPANYGVEYRIFYTDVSLPPGKTVASVTLPAASAIHVFAVAAG